jgi:tRNA threonylcarbamoyl adenosine modification protein (Sua5/YciO/YrdC/YwlC family)
MLIKIHPDNPDPRRIHGIVKALQDGAVIIYPTDTVYALGCDIFNNKAMERLATIKHINLSKTHLSFMCYDLSHLADYTTPLNNSTFKLLKHNLPGAFTFILNANNKIPKHFRKSKKTVGIRIPDNNIARELVKQLGNPILTTSLTIPDDINEYPTNPELIHELFEKQVDIVIDGGYGDVTPSTIVDCTKDELEIIREGKGILK